MKVSIDGVEYAPKDNRVIVHGIEYESIQNWLMNIHSNLISNWVDAVKKEGGSYCKGMNSKLDSLHDRIGTFERFCKDYLGFETRDGEIGFFEVEQFRPLND